MGLRSPRCLGARSSSSWPSASPWTKEALVPYITTFHPGGVGEGISKTGEILDLAVTLGIVQKSGAWFSYGETRLGQGRDNVKIYFKEHPELMAEIEELVRQNADKLVKGGKKAKGSVTPVVAAPAPAAAEAPAKEKAAAVSEADLDIMVED